MYIKTCIAIEKLKVHKYLCMDSMPNFVNIFFLKLSLVYKNGVYIDISYGLNNVFKHLFHMFLGWIYCVYRFGEWFSFHEVYVKIRC